MKKDYAIVYRTDGYKIWFDNRDEWEARIEEIAEETPFDIDFDDTVCFVDDGDPAEEEW